MDPGSSLTFSAETEGEVREHSQEALTTAREIQRVLPDIDIGGNDGDGTSPSAHSMPNPPDATEMSEQQQQEEQQQRGADLADETRERQHLALRSAIDQSRADLVALAEPVDAASLGTIFAAVDAISRAEVRVALEMIHGMLQQVRQAVLTDDEQKRVRFVVFI